MSYFIKYIVFFLITKIISIFIDFGAQRLYNTKYSDFVLFVGMMNIVKGLK